MLNTPLSVQIVLNLLEDSFYHANIRISNRTTQSISVVFEGHLVRIEWNQFTGWKYPEQLTSFVDLAFKQRDQLLLTV